MKRDAELLPPFTAIDDGRRPDHPGARGARHLDRFASRTSRGHDVLDDKYRLTWRQRKPAPECQRAVLALGEDCPHAKGPADLLPDDDAPERW